MKKIIISTIFLIILIPIIYTLYMNYRIKHAIIKVETIDDLNIEVYSEIKTKDLIKSINGKIINNKKINTEKLGKKEVTFKYINEENLKIDYSFDINIVDTTPPIISNHKKFTFYKESNVDLESKFFCGDNYDDKPNCEIIGEYNLDEIGKYDLTYKATDKEGNETVNNFTVNIIERPKNTTNKSTKTNTKNTLFSEIKEKYNNYKVGIDISHHQGDIDYKKIKEAGVDFVFIRVGSQKGKNGEYYLDSKFKENIKGLNQEKIPVGIYFFSYADNNKEALKQAKWVIKQIKDYKISLPVVFDWENWTKYKEYNLSFYHLTQIATTFTDEIEKHGYETMLYSSKYYLENIWQNPKQDIWLAHYTNKTDYKGKYKVWQICDDGKIDGINDNYVDIDILYE
ncbi:MAG: glycoside hydrolase family 25 protein [Bacilli bacterium]|nr:glycoside hydrolase family 25 protein [Bacilli bacterium]